MFIQNAGVKVIYYIQRELFGITKKISFQPAHIITIYTATYDFFATLISLIKIITKKC